MTARVTPAEAQAMLDEWTTVTGGPWSGLGYGASLAMTVVLQGREIARLREALEPFSVAADEADEWGYDDENQASVSVGECRVARTALEAKP